MSIPITNNRDGWSCLARDTACRWQTHVNNGSRKNTRINQLQGSADDSRVYTVNYLSTILPSSPVPPPPQPQPLRKPCISDVTTNPHCPTTPSLLLSPHSMHANARQCTPSESAAIHRNSAHRLFSRRRCYRTVDGCGDPMAALKPLMCLADSRGSDLGS
jgi:hypothetical protein